MTEERAAQILNVTMAALLGALVLGFAAWACVAEFGDVRAIYRWLPSNAQGKVNVFLGSVLFLTNSTVLALSFLNRWRAHPVVRPVLRALKDWAPLAVLGAVILPLRDWKWSLVWLAAAVIMIGAELITAWRARRARAQ